MCPHVQGGSENDCKRTTITLPSAVMIETAPKQ